VEEERSGQEKACRCWQGRKLTRCVGSIPASGNQTFSLGNCVLPSDGEGGRAISEPPQPVFSRG